MSDTRKVIIEIINGDGGQREETRPVVDRQVGSVAAQQAAPSVGEVSIVSILASQVYNQAKGLVKNATMYYVSRHLTLKEDYINERNLSNTLTLINRGASFATTVAGGAVVGGGLVGAIVAGIGWGASQALSEYQRFDVAYRNLSENKINIAFQRTRVGLSGEGRTEN